MSAAEATTCADVYRPVQYLGSKLRTMAAVRSAVGAGSGPQTVWEPFSGSSVVSQALAADGHRIVAWDALVSSATFAQALLGAGRDDDHDDGWAFAERLLALSRPLPVPDGWAPWLMAERAAITERDGSALLAIGTDLPQSWREGPEGSVPRAPGATPPLISETLAGTYFGLKQALRLERLRAAVDLAEERGRVTPWDRSVALTALCAAASAAVFSAGKHFAQPHRVQEGKDLRFHAQRALRDRAVDVDEVFTRAMLDIRAAARPAVESHRASCRRVEDATATDLRGWGVTAVYADPPYTAQQYSRYYHVLETLVSGELPALQRVRGEVTRGLYPDGRYLSPFCSRRQAPAAFRHLAEISSRAGARLVLSYSASSSGETGNARTLSLADLVFHIQSAYPQNAVTVTELGVRYRQFNHQGSAAPGRDDPEYLIIGEPDAG